MNSSSFKVCRTCLSRVRHNECICISTEEDNAASILEMLSFTIPEMNLYLVSHPVLCKRCFKLLKVCFQFKTECIRSEEHLLKHSQNNNSEMNVEDIPLPKFEKKLVKDHRLKIKNIRSNELSSIQELSCENSDAILNHLKCEKCYGCEVNSLDPSRHKKVSPSSPTCYMCNKRLNNLNEMRKHIMSHIGLRKCKVCKKHFRDLSQLKIHLRVHTQAKPYKCDLCDKAFRQKHSLTQHMYQHTGSASVVCKHCNKAFSTKYNAQVHMKSCHKVLEKCDLCGETFVLKKDLIKHLESSTENCKGEFINVEVKEEIDNDYKEENFSFIKAEPIVTENAQEVVGSNSFFNVKQEFS